MNHVRVSSIETLGLLDGPGVRTVIFLKDCPLRCIFCHNPETWASNEYTEYSTDDLFQKIVRYKSYYRDNGGVTFSGGEPLVQSCSLIDLCKRLKEENINIALDTSGYYVNEDYKELLTYIDLVIYDIKSVYEEGYEYITKRKIDTTNKFISYVLSQNKKLWIRQVIIPGINDSYEYINDLYEFIKTYKNVDKYELLPYSSIGKQKYEQLGLNYPLKNTIDMDKKKCQELNDYLNKLLLK